MTVSTAPQGDQRHRPFQCAICQARFSRGENLKRHTAIHNRIHNKEMLSCPICSVTFSRVDLRNRHMKRKHSEPGDQQPTLMQPERRTAVQNSDHQTEPAYSAGALSPCGRGFRGLCQSQPGDHGILYSSGDSHAIDRIVESASNLERNLLSETSLLSSSQTLEEPHFRFTGATRSESNGPSFANLNMPLDMTLWGSGPTPPQSKSSLSPGQIQRGCDLFFAHVSPFLPIIHKPTFDVAQAVPQLILSMLSLGYQYGEDPDSGGTERSGSNLSRHCFQQARALIASEETREDDLSYNFASVQSYLLLQICAMMYLCGPDSAHGLKMHPNMISLCRASGITQPPETEASTATDLDSLWREFARVESHKRTVFAVHQIDALWYQFLSIPRSISHLEIKHDLPCPEDHWAASSSAEWAHRRLISKNSRDSVQYGDAIRCLLSPDSDLSALPSFDPYGAINLTHFLISSAREISGWSTMTGMLSMERSGCLKTSLLTLLPFIYPEGETPRSANAVTCMATWQTAMLELQLWSPSHIGGIVGGTMDAMLSQLTTQAPTYDFLFNVDTVQAIEPHVQWFLRYLDELLLPDSEAPWIALYAYRAFLIAWQLVCGGTAGVMQVVGVADGDIAGAVAWARKVFGRRRRWKLGQLILSCLHDLETCHGK
ncbi:transcription factor domain-containing protein [Aspergillus lucknowensis]|uniref:Fungal-specific transcription factor domain-containing protein n=1 Tax=Aspergillus lucknowensis TaxID=176173 RepID=A0ABR4M4A5_9EURO